MKKKKRHSRGTFGPDEEIEARRKLWRLMLRIYRRERLARKAVAA